MLRHRAHPASRAAAGAIVALVAASVLAGCHDEERLRERLKGPRSPQPMRLPVEPDQPSTPPAPALLDTVLPWQPPKAIDTRAWDIECLPIGGGRSLTYRVPVPWIRSDERCDGEAHNRTDLVEAVLVITPLRDDRISLATYAGQLAEGNPIYQYTTLDGHAVYLTRREVSVAPSDPAAPREVFHTAVIDVDGRIAKLDVRYDVDVKWRFSELADAIAGTLQVSDDGDDG